MGLLSGVHLEGNVGLGPVGIMAGYWPGMCPIWIILPPPVDFHGVAHTWVYMD